MTTNRDALGRSPLTTEPRPLLMTLGALVAALAGLGFALFFWRAELLAALIPVLLITLCVIAFGWAASRLLE